MASDPGQYCLLRPECWSETRTVYQVKLFKETSKDQWERHYHKLRSPNTGKHVQLTHYSEATTVNMGEPVTRVPDN